MTKRIKHHLSLLLHRFSTACILGLTLNFNGYANGDIVRGIMICTLDTISFSIAHTLITPSKSLYIVNFFFASQFKWCWLLLFCAIFVHIEKSIHGCTLFWINSTNVFLGAAVKQWNNLTFLCDFNFI